MKMRLLISICCLALLLTSPRHATAQQQGQSTVEQRVTQWLRPDANADGVLDKDEVTGLMKTFFARNDTNQDGKLDRDELQELAKRLDASRANNGSGKNNSTAQPARRGASTPTTEQVITRAPENVQVIPDIAYREGPSKAWRLDLVMPKELGDEPRPAIVFVHGGGWSSGDKRAGTFLNGAFNYASKGYVCITVNYRLTQEAPFPACIEDVKCAVRWLRAHAEKYNVDPERIGGYGNSAGAHLVAMLGLAGPEAKLEGDGPHQDESSLLQAVCCSATPADFLLNPDWLGNRSKSGLLAGPVETVRQRAKQASPVTHVSDDAPPMLVIHGTADRTVDVKHGDRLVEALKQAKAKDVTYIRVDGAGHGVFNSHAKQTQPAMEAFFKRTIGKK